MADGYRLGVIGAGNMAMALVRGILDAGELSAERVTVCDPVAAQRELFAAALGVVTSEENADAARCEVVLLAIKPQVFELVVSGIREAVSADTLVLSIVAGIRTEQMHEMLPAARLIRIMPNTPALVGYGVAGIAQGANATAMDVALACALMGAVGTTHQIPESDMDALAAVSGCGPAYVFRFVELLGQAGEEAGLSKELAAALARETIIGAGRLLETAAESPTVLRERVTSPGGMTAAALAAFEAGDWGALVTRAVQAANARGAELAALKS